MRKFENSYLTFYVQTVYFIDTQQFASMRKFTISYSFATWLYFTQLTRRFLDTDFHKFWVTYSTRGRNQFCKVLSQSVEWFGFYEESNFGHSHGNATLPLTQGLTIVRLVILSL